MVKPLVLLEEKVAVVILNHKFRASRLHSHYYYHRDDQGGGFLPYPEYVEICPGVVGWRVAIGSGCECLKKDNVTISYDIIKFYAFKFEILSIGTVCASP